MKMRSESLFGSLLVMCAFAALACAALAFVPSAGVEAKEADGTTIVVLKDGMQLVGDILEENEKQIVVKTSFGRITVKRARIKEIKRGENPYLIDWEERYQRASRKKDVPALFRVANFAKDNKLDPQWQKTLERVVEIEPDNTEARGQLGHAKFEGDWVDADKVESLRKQGYELVGFDLVKKGDGAGSTAVEPRTTPREKTGAEKRKHERHLKKIEKYKRAKAEEFDPIPWDRRHRIKTKNYEIECNSTRKVAETYAWIMEELFKVLSTRLTDSDVRKSRSKVFVYANHEEFMEMSGAGPRVGGFYQPATQEIHAYHGSFAQTATTLAVLAHEGTHQIQGRKLGARGMGNFPMWFIEGMAVYYGDGSRLDYKKKTIVTGLIPRERLLPLWRKMDEGTHEPLRRLIGLKRQNFSGSQYADSWAVIHFLFDGPQKKKGRKMMVELWMTGKERQLKVADFERLATKYFGSLEELETQLFAYVRSLKPDPTGEIKGKRFVSKEFKIAVDIAGAEWTWDTAPEDSQALVTQFIPDTDVRIQIRQWAKENVQQDDDDWLKEIWSAGFKEIYKLESREMVQFDVHPAHAVVYRQKPPKKKKKDDDNAQEPKKEGEPPKPAPEAADKKPLVKRCDYVFCWVDKAFVVRCEAPIKEFKKYEGLFLNCAATFEIMVENRW